VYGRVLWRGEPLEGFVMVIKGGRQDRKVKTNSEGIFSFRDLQSGDYTLGGVIADSELEGLAAVWEDPITVPTDTNYNYGEYWLLEPDLVLLAPESRSEIDELQPSFRWEAYPGAAYYRLKLYSRSGEYINLDISVKSPEYNLEKPLLACSYSWDVIAYDESDIPLARSNALYLGGEIPHDPYHDGVFIVNNDEIGNCRIKLISPEDFAKVTQFPLVFQWETQPLVVRYHLNIDTKACTGIGSGPCSSISPRVTWHFFSGDFLLQEDGTLTGPATRPFPPAWQVPRVLSYSWSITGYDQDGHNIANSFTQWFTIP
jgi:hypothetical protein